MLWIPLAFGSYFLGALAAIIDKIILRRDVRDPLLFAFYTGLLSIGVLILAPLGFWLPLQSLLAAIATGACSLVALYYTYRALKIADASRVIPLLSAAVPIFIIFLAYVLTNTALDPTEFRVLFVFIVAGIFLGYEKYHGQSFFNPQVILLSLASAFFSALYYFFFKVLLLHGSFFPVVVWTRLGAFVAALALFIFPAVRRKILSAPRASSPSSYVLFVTNKIIGACGLLLLSYAIKLGPVAIINAMRGLENFFIFIFAFLLTSFAPRTLRESFDLRSVQFKVIGLILIVVGFVSLCSWSRACYAVF